MNFLQFILDLFKTVPQDMSDVHPLGVLPDEIDVRDIPYAAVHASQDLPLNYMTDVSMVPEINQGSLGTCVAHAFAFAKMFLDHQETKKMILYSRRFLYVLARRFGQYDFQNEGLYPRQAAKILTSVGIVMDYGFDLNNLTHSNYVDGYSVTDEMRKEANLYRAGGFAFPERSVEGIKQAVFRSKIVPVTIKIDKSTIDKTGAVRPPKRVTGLHEVVIIGWESNNGRERFVFQNWWTKKWGTGGKGYIYTDEFYDVVTDAIVFTDIPNDLIERARKMQYIFLKELRLGSRGDSVKQLQKRLVEYGLLEDAIDGAFGKKTFAAVKEYQRLKGITENGVVDKITRDTLNSDVSIQTQKSKIDIWCEAIKSREGYFAPGELGAYPNGSVSWRNKNPGNLKYVGQKLAINTGPKDGSKFCTFNTYEDGYKTLRDMLVRACTGGSAHYKPDMTLAQFYEIYAPAEDSNDPASYAREVARKLEVDALKTQIKTFL